MGDKVDKAIEMITGLKKNISSAIKNSNPNARNSPHKNPFNWKLLIFALSYILIVYRFIILEIGGYIDYLTISQGFYKTLNLILNQFFKGTIEKTFLVLGFLPLEFISIALGFLLAAIFMFDIYILPFFSILSTDEEGPGSLIYKILLKELTFVGVMLLTILGIITLNVAIVGTNPEISTGEVIQKKVNEVGDSYMWCVLKNSITDPRACEDMQKDKKAKESEKTKYEIRLLPLNIESYVYTQDSRNKVEFYYKFFTQGGYIKLDKFACYHNKVNEDNIIGEEQDLDGEIVMAHNALDQRVFTCDLSKLTNPINDAKFKIIPVLTYTIDSEISQEIPIVTIQGYDEDEYDYFEARERYKSAFSSLSAIISNKVIEVSTRWNPEPPIFTNEEEENTDYTIDFTFEKNSLQTSYELGKIITSKLNKLSIPERFEKNCGENDKDCKEELLTEILDGTSKSHLRLNLKLKEKPKEPNSVEYITMNVESQMELKHTRYIDLKNPEYVDPASVKKDEENESKTQQTTTSTYWADKETELNSIQNEYKSKNDAYTSIEKEYASLSTLINEGFEVINQGKSIETKTNLTSYDEEKNMEFKISYSNIETQIDKLKTEIDNKINSEIENDPDLWA